MAFEMRKHEHGIIVLKMGSHIIFRQMMTACYRKGHMALFVQDITGSNGCEPMVPHGLPVSFGSVPSSLIGSIALHNGALKFLYKVPDKLRLQEIAAARLPCGDLYRCAAG